MAATSISSGEGSHASTRYRDHCAHRLAAARSSAQALTPADKCEADKLKRAGKYNFCRLKAESKAIKTASSPDYTLCDSKLSQKWTNAELIGGGQCLTNGDLGSMTGAHHRRRQ